MSRSRKPHEEPAAGAQYRGRAGQTRTERVHLVEEDGSVGAHDIYRVVNVTTHPSLKETVLSGALHVLEDGRELAVPFVYHDPMERKFALVIPPALAHLEMKEWSALLQEITADTSVPVPAYVRDSTTVLGIGALDYFLDTEAEPDEIDDLSASVPPLPPPPEPDPAALEALEQQQRELQEREQRAADLEREAAERANAAEARASEASSAERELQERTQALEAQEQSIKEREQQAEARTQEAEQRLRDAEARAKEAESREQQAQSREREAAEREQQAAERERDAEARAKEAETRAKDAAADDRSRAEEKDRAEQALAVDREAVAREREAVAAERAKLAEERKALADTRAAQTASIEKERKALSETRAEQSAKLESEREAAAAAQKAQADKLAAAQKAQADKLAKEQQALQEVEAELTAKRESLGARERELNAQVARVEEEQARVVRDAARASDGDRTRARGPMPTGQWQEASGEPNTDDQPTALHDMSEYHRESSEVALRGRRRVVEGAEALPDLLKSPSRTQQRFDPGKAKAPRPAPAPAGKPVPPPAARSETARKSSAGMPTPPPAAGSVPPPPPGFASLPPGRMQLDTSAKELWAFAPLAPADSHAFQQGCDLLVQLVAADRQPVALLTLVDRDGHVVRTAFDPVGEDGRALLKRLERSFRLKVAFFVEGRARDVQTVSALRESAVRAVRERIEALGAGPATRAQLDAVLADPPPHRDDSLPFVPTRPQTATTARVLSAVQSLEVWNEPDKLDEALLLYSVPKHVVEASSRRILRSAQSFGIALSVGLAQLAVRLGVVQDRSRLLQDQMQSFRQRIERGENDLDAAATLQNWGRLFAAAEQLSLEVEPHYRELSDRAALDAGVQPLPSIPPGGARELQAQLSDRGKRLAAIEALCGGGHVGAIGSICEVLDDLRPDEVPLAVVHLLSLGEHAGDGLIAGLGSRSQFVRQACALGLGQLRLQRALPPLLRQLQSEPTSSWSELARALGDFGPVALPAIVEGLQGAERPERLMVGLAHVANHGGALDVENLENFQSSVVASAARQALSRRERMDAEDHAVRENGALRDNSPEARFSQSFYAAVAARAA